MHKVKNTYIKYPQTRDTKNCLRGTSYKHVDQVSFAWLILLSNFEKDNLSKMI